MFYFFGSASLYISKKTTNVDEIKTICTFRKPCVVFWLCCRWVCRIQWVTTRDSRCIVLCIQNACVWDSVVGKLLNRTASEEQQQGFKTGSHSCYLSGRTKVRPAYKVIPFNFFFKIKLLFISMGINRVHVQLLTHVCKAVCGNSSDGDS